MTIQASSILSTLPLVRLRFDLEVLGDCEVPAHKGDMLRMALLWYLSDFWCPMKDRCRDGCRRPAVCLFGRLCGPMVDPDWPAPERHLMGHTPPPAYTLWDGADRRRIFFAGDRWHFEMLLAGELALSQLAPIVEALQKGADEGMGRVRLRSQVRQVMILIPAPEKPTAERLLVTRRPSDQGEGLTWLSYRLEDVMLDNDAGLRWARQLDRPVRGFSLRFLSPVKIKERSEWVRQPDFRPVMKSLVRRIRLLSLVHGPGAWPHAEYGPMLDLAETVQLAHDETHWAGYPRYSKSSGHQEVEGFVGQAWYAGEDLRPLLPVLWLGQWLHIGKGYVLGNGRYCIEQIF